MILSRIPNIPNSTNAKLLNDSHDYLKTIGSSDSHIKNELHQHHPCPTPWYQDHILDVNDKKQIIEFLDTKKKARDSGKSRYSWKVSAVSIL